MEDKTLSVTKVEHEPLAFSDLRRMLGKDAKDTNLILYEQLQTMTLVDFLKHPAIIILIHQQGQKVGHFFVILIKNYTIEHFDPYGYDLNNLFRITQQSPILLKKMYNESKKKIIVNSIKFQTLNKNMDTCGRWCVGRIKLKERDLKQFQKFMNQTIQSNDAKITWITYFL